MAEATNKYLELSTINRTKNETIQSILVYNGEDLTQNPNYTKLTLWKWNIICNNFPTWLPSLRDPKYNSVYKPFAPPGVDSGSVFYRNPPNEKFSEWFLTNWSITMKYRTSHTPSGSTYMNSYVQFLKYKKNAPSSIKFDLDGDSIEKTILEDKNHYAWGNATMLCNMINESMNTFGAYSGLSYTDFRFVKNGSYWTLLYKVGLDIEKVYFNEPMRRLFDFPYDEDFGITLVPGAITTLNNIDYYSISTEKTNTYLFPFRKVGMTFHGLNVQPQFVFNNNNTTTTATISNLLTSYTLNITDINQIGNCIEFATETKDRSLSLTDSQMGSFSITVYFETALGNMLILDLEPLDEVNLLFMIH